LRHHDADRDSHRREDLQLIGTLWGGQIAFTTAMLFAVAFIAMFIIGGSSA